MRSSLHTLLLLSLSSTALAATNLIPHKPPARLLAQFSPSSHFQDVSVVIGAQCRPGELTCNDGCMPSIASCCPDGEGYCKQGYACVTDGCCPIGHTCSDVVTCDIGEVPCGDKKCMPKNAVCCSDGAYCQAGEECFQNGFKQYCQRATGSQTIGAAETTSSRRQSTSLSKTTHEEAPTSTSETPASTSAETQTQADASTSTSVSSRNTSSIFTNPDHPIVTPFLPKPSTTSATTTEFTSASTTDASTATTTSGGNPAAVKMSGLTLALVIVSIMMAF